MRKFWEKVQLKKNHISSYEIFLDNKILRTPLKKKLTIPNTKIGAEIYKE